MFTVIIAVGLIAANLAGCGLLPQEAGAGGASSALTASGTIQADRIRLAPQIGGKIRAIAVNQGDLVQPGETVFSLDDAGFQVQRKQAQAAMLAAQAAQAATQANLELLQSGATTPQIQAAQAQLDQAEANRKAAQSTIWSVAGSTRPEDISAAQARLDQARQEYFSLVVTLDPGQVEKVTAVLNEAQAALIQAQARHDRLEADKRTPASALDASANAVTDAQAAADSAKAANQSVEDTSLPFYQQITAARNTWETAQLNLTQAQSRLTSLRAASDMLKEALDAAQSGVDDAQSLVDKAKKAYDALNTGDQADRLNAAWTQVQNAQRDLEAMGHATGTGDLETLLNELSAVTAQRDAAQANVKNLKNGPRPAEISAAQAQVDAAKAKVAEAQAALDMIEVQMAQLEVAAPVNGVVLNRSMEPGEIVGAGIPVVEIGDLSQLTLRVYVPEDQYGKIKLGQSVTVSVDSFPGRNFTGTVSSIANQAEFTPRNVQTTESRSTTVYAIEIHLANPDQSLKPGMPADARF